MCNSSHCTDKYIFSSFVSQLVDFVSGERSLPERWKFSIFLTASGNQWEGH